MNLSQILIPVVIMAAIGLVLGLLLAIAGKVFYVKKDEKAEAVLACLPGANCGGCGYAGCSSYAEAVVNSGAPVNKCSVGGNSVSDEIAGIMGVEKASTVRMRAQVMCSGTRSMANRKYKYAGLADCLSVAKLGNGPKECRYGCIGLGTCAKACPFGAIKVTNGVAVVEYEKCKACGVCVSTCPQNIIELIPYDTDVWVGCASKDKGAVVRTLCKVGCIGCGLCAKVCPTAAITVEDSVASINYDKCINCGACVAKCPRKIIWSGKEQVEHGDTIAAVAASKRRRVSAAKGEADKEPYAKPKENAKIIAKEERRSSERIEKDLTYDEFQILKREILDKKASEEKATGTRGKLKDFEELSENKNSDKGKN